MLTCLPMSWCSGDYRISGAVAGPGTAAFNWGSEQGEVSLGSETCTVCKQGLMSGIWTLDLGGRVIARAQKPSAMFRQFEIVCEGRSFDLRAASVFTRDFVLSENGRQCGAIQAMHAFTRRATVQCRENVPEWVQLFAFWLVALMWRRAANSSSS
jgi:hypothetical protein